MIRYSLETTLQLTGCATLNNALLHKQKQLGSLNNGLIRAQVYFNCLGASAAGVTHTTQRRAVTHSCALGTVWST